KLLVELAHPMIVGTSGHGNGHEAKHGEDQGGRRRRDGATERDDHRAVTSLSSRRCHTYVGGRRKVKRLGGCDADGQLVPEQTTRCCCRSSGRATVSPPRRQKQARIELSAPLTSTSAPSCDDAGANDCR